MAAFYARFWEPLGLSRQLEAGGPQLGSPAT